jgi:hypothetical protein
MLISLALTAYRRPQYLRQSLETIQRSVEFARKQDSSLEFVLVSCVEPGNEEVRSIIESTDFVQHKRYYNQSVLGMNQNVKQSFEYAFSASNYVVELNDDGLLSEDGLWYATSMLKLFEHDDNVLYISSYHGNLTDTRPNCYFKHYGAYNSGAIMSKNRWEQWFKPNWIKSSIMCYDTWFNNIFPKDKAAIIPVVCRSRHIGATLCTYSNPQIIEDAARNLCACDFPPTISFKEVPTLSI